ncbi:hypothetical protein HDV57DRAFT_501172 [Trichoderma longibrachiatum]
MAAIVSCSPWFALCFALLQCPICLALPLRVVSFSCSLLLVTTHTYRHTGALDTWLCKRICRFRDKRGRLLLDQTCHKCNRAW